MGTRATASSSPPGDPSAPLRERASEYPDVDEGTACTQSSFKTGGRAFLFVGMQGGRHKAMFKLRESLPGAEQLAARDPDRFQVGKGGWVTARFTSQAPLPKKVWRAWLDESHALMAGDSPKPPRKRPARKA